ncbi:MAG: hypothetical protein GX318_09345 [Clostridia bacterium]|nr:hypothetical protein [Clostridia bacterium]
MENYIQEMLDTQIPLAGHMGIKVKKIASDGGVVLTAPLLPNHNHKGTGFGGSIASIALLCGWTTMMKKFKEWGFKGEAVVANLQVDYLLPVEDDFEARCPLPPRHILEEFKENLLDRGKAKITLNCRVSTGEKLAAEIQGLFVARLLS